jgi:hypothetical protein
VLDSGGTGGEEGKRFPVDFKHITAGGLNAVPDYFDEAALEGPVVVTASCDPIAVAEFTPAALEGAFLVVKRGCNVYATTRLAVEHGAVAVAFAVDNVAENRWVPRDRTLKLPILSIEYAVADSIQTMVRRGKQVRGSLSASPYVPSFLPSFVPLFLHLSSFLPSSPFLPAFLPSFLCVLSPSSFLT